MPFPTPTAHPLDNDALRDQAARQNNNVGFLRLVLASCVIVGHSAQIRYGKLDSQFMVHFFRNERASLAFLSVDAFFLLSGYLVSASVLRIRSVPTFLWHRLLRIYPAYFCAYIFTVFIYGHWAGADPWPALKQTLLRLVLLKQPMNYPGQLAKSAMPILNAPMWTIQHEFQCYVAIALLFAIGGFKTRLTPPFITILLIVIYVAVILGYYEYFYGTLQGHPLWTSLIADANDYDVRHMALARFLPIFFVGCCFYVLRDRLIDHASGAGAGVMAIAGLAALYFLHDAFGEIALVLTASYTLFWLAFRVNLGRLNKINNSWDISYGTYLYGWPIGEYIVRLCPDLPLWQITCATLLLAYLFGAVSWLAIEQWCKPQTVSVFLTRRRDHRLSRPPYALSK